MRTSSASSCRPLPFPFAFALDGGAFSFHSLVGSGCHPGGGGGGSRDLRGEGDERGRGGKGQKTTNVEGPAIALTSRVKPGRTCEPSTNSCWRVKRFGVDCREDGQIRRAGKTRRRRTFAFLPLPVLLIRSKSSSISSSS